jgi:hypothetical protein
MNAVVANTRAAVKTLVTEAEKILRDQGDDPLDPLGLLDRCYIELTFSEENKPPVVWTLLLSDERFSMQRHPESPPQHEPEPIVDQLTNDFFSRQLANIRIEAFYVDNAATVEATLRTLVDGVKEKTKVPAPAAGGGNRKTPKPRKSKFDAMTVAELRRVAIERGIKVSGLRKAELVAAVKTRRTPRSQS